MHPTLIQPVARDAAIRRYVYAYPFALLSAWVIAWLAHNELRSRFHWNVNADTLYWIGMKLIIWVLPVFALIHWVENRDAAEFLELGNAGKGMLWGFGAGFALIASTFLLQTLPSGARLHLPMFSLVLANAVLVAPVVEEIALRGFLMKRIQMNGTPFWIANSLTTLTFAAMHIPGWYFGGRTAMLASFLPALASLCMLSLVFGWTKNRAGSLYAALIPHFLNNVYSSLLAK